MIPRRATKDDIPLLLALAHELREGHGKHQPPVDEPWLRAMIETGLDQPNIVVFADERGFEVIHAGPRLHSPNWAARIGEFFLRPDARTLANRRAFINAAIMWAKEQHADSLSWGFERGTGRSLKTEGRVIYLG